MGKEIIKIRSELDLPSLSKTVTNEDFIWYLCNSDLKRINQIGEDELIVVMSNTFIAVMESLGIKKDPSDKASEKMILFFRRNYGELYPCEIELAFDLALVGKINVKLEHFQDFNLAYVIPVIREYKKYRANVLVEGAKLHKPKTIAEHATITDAELKKKEMAHLTEFWDEFIEKGWNHHEYRFTYIYSILCRRGNKPDILELMTEKAKEFMAQALPIAEFRAQSRERKAGQRAITDLSKAINDAMGSDVKRVAKELIVKHYFEHLKEKESDIYKAIEIWEKK